MKLEVFLNFEIDAIINEVSKQTKAASNFTFQTAFDLLTNSDGKVNIKACPIDYLFPLCSSNRKEYKFCPLGSFNTP